MTNKLKMLAIAAAMTAGTSSLALAQACPPGYFYNAGYCSPASAYTPTPAPGTYAPDNPLSGAAAGEAAGAASGAATAGPVGAIVGGALGTAAGTLAGTANAVTGAPVAPIGTAPPAYYGSSVPPAPASPCGPGRTLYMGYCY